MNKAKKRVLVAGLASSMILGMCSSAMAASNAYVGNQGFALDSVLNDTNYETSFKAYLGKNIASGLYIDFDGNGSAVATDDFLNSTGGQTLLQFESANETAKTGPIWDGKSELGGTGEFEVVEISAINLTQVTVTFSSALDEAAAANFSIAGLTVSSATLSEDKKSVVLSVTGTEVGKTYTLKATGLKVAGDVQPDFNESYTAPTQAQAYKPTVTFKDAVIKADGASSTLVTFTLRDAAGNVISDAQNVEVALTSTFGNFAEKRVTVQNGVATSLLTSETLTADKVADVTVTVVEATDNNLYGLKATGSIKMSPDPSGGEVTTGASMTEAEAYQADRVIVYFNQAVSVDDYVYPSTDLINAGKVDPLKAVIKVTTNVNNDGITGGTVVPVTGLMPVAGNDKALQLILDKNDANFPLIDNANVKAEFTDLTGSVAVPSTKLFKLTDARKPAMLNVTREGLKTIKVEFSEPVNDVDFSAISASNLAIDGKILSNVAFGTNVNPANITIGDFIPKTGEDTRNVVTITLGKNALLQQIYFQTGDHSIQGSNIGDWAASSDSTNVMNTQTLDFNIPVDGAIPTATVQVQSPEQFVVKFDKDLNQDAADLIGKLTLQKYNATISAFEDVDVATQEIMITNITPLAGTTTFLVQVKKDWTEVYGTAATNKNYYNDSYRLHVAKDAISAAANGLKNAEISLTLGGALLVPDVLSPKIELISQSVDSVTGTSYDVTMSEPVKIGAANYEGLTFSEAQLGAIPTPTAEFIKKDNSLTIPATVSATFVDDVNKVIEVTPSQILTAGEWTLVVRSISDDVGNTAASATKDFTVTAAPTSGTAFQVTWATVDADGEYDALAGGINDVDADYVLVKFNKPVSLTGDYKNALKTANYALNGTALPQGTQIVANISGYDDVDSIVDSITIVLPNNTIKTSTVLNVSPSIQSAAGEIITNAGEKKLPYNFGALATKDATNLLELKAALANDSYRQINYTGADIPLGLETLNVSRLVNLDLNGAQITGNVSVATTVGGQMTIDNATITGNLTVNTPNADFTVGAGASVTGTTTIKDVASSTFINMGTLENVVIEDANGTAFDNTSGTVNGTVTLNTTGAVTLEGDIDDVIATKAAIVTVAPSSTVTNFTAAAADVVLTGTGTVTNTLATGSGTIETPAGDVVFAVSTKVITNNLATLGLVGTSATSTAIGVATVTTSGGITIKSETAGVATITVMDALEHAAFIDVTVAQNGAITTRIRKYLAQ